MGALTTPSNRPAQRLAAFAGKCTTTRRVLQVITPSHMSGAEMQLVRLTRRMQARGHQMPILVKQNWNDLVEMIHYGLDLEPAQIGGKFNPLALARIARAARLRRVELTQSTLSTASWWCGWLESVGGPKSIGHVQGFTSARWHSRQSHLLAVSNAVRDHLTDQGIPRERITVLHNALDADEFVPRRCPLAVRAELGAEEDTPVIGVFAHLSPKKGHRELFAAMPRVLAAHPKTQLWVVGQGALRAELIETANTGGFLDRVRFTGFRRDAADLMNAIDCLALPSHREPCALAYVEAALLRKPIVACAAGGTPESVADEETGLLVPVGDSRAIADALLTLLDNRGLARRLGQAGHERARELFSWDRFIATLEGVYDRVLSQAI